jgi:hypoxanthine phosphoribosyltransferase
LSAAVSDSSAEALAVRRSARRVFSALEVRRAIGRMALEAGAVLEGTDPVVIAVMHGGAYTALELSRRFSFPHEFDYVHATRYDGEVSGSSLRWRVRPSASLAGRTVLLVDDVLDHGVTLAALQAALGEARVARQLTAVLVVKDVAVPNVRPHVDFVGLTAGDAYLFGCGMDYKGYWRSLPALYAVEEARAGS